MPQKLKCASRVGRSSKLPEEDTIRQEGSGFKGGHKKPSIHLFKHTQACSSRVEAGFHVAALAILQQWPEETQLSGGEVSMEGKAVAAGVTEQDNVHFLSTSGTEETHLPPSEGGKISNFAKVVSRILGKKRETNCSDLLQILNLKPLPTLLLHCYAVPGRI